MGRQRIGLLGGTFDPIHTGHLLLAVHSYDKLALDRVMFIPTRKPPHKDKPLAEPGDRLKMVRLAIADDDRFLVCDCELNRAEPSYTIETVRQMQDSLGGNPEMFWLIGSDMLAELSSWHEVSQLVDSISIVVVRRGGEDRPNFCLLKPTLTAEQIEALKSQAVDTALIQISSTEIRQRIARGESIRYLLPESVRQYLEDHKLYR